MGEGHEFDPLPGSYGYNEMAFYQRIERYFYGIFLRSRTMWRDMRSKLNLFEV